MDEIGDRDHMASVVGSVADAFVREVAEGLLLLREHPELRLRLPSNLEEPRSSTTTLPRAPPHPSPA